MAMTSYWESNINFALHVASHSYACSSLIMGNMGETDLSNDPESYFLEDEDEFFEVFERSFDANKDGLAYNSDEEPLELEQYGAIIVSLNEMQKRTREILKKVGFTEVGPIPQGKNTTYYCSDNGEPEYHDIYIMVGSAEDLARRLEEWKAEKARKIYEG